MADGYDETNKGVLFREEERKSDRSPTHTGRVTVLDDSTGELKTFRVAGWTKESRSGKKFLSLALTPQDSE
jgi:uncharacterized protein (DUF736 family)